MEGPHMGLHNNVIIFSRFFININVKSISRLPNNKGENLGEESLGKSLLCLAVYLIFIR